jgi:hypothetical protein
LHKVTEHVAVEDRHSRTPRVKGEIGTGE